ncbi:MAG: hypothetical protein ACM37W_10215 [Actinomycetota bacterium]
MQILAFFSKPYLGFAEEGVKGVKGVKESRDKKCKRFEISHQIWERLRGLFRPDGPLMNADFSFFQQALPNRQAILLKQQH